MDFYFLIANDRGHLGCMKYRIQFGSMHLVKDINGYKVEKSLNAPNFPKMDHICLSCDMTLSVGQEPIIFETKYCHLVVEWLYIYDDSIRPG